MPAARISVICDECIRIEWSPGADERSWRFVDEPSMFAAVRPRPRRVTIADGAAGAPPVRVATPRCEVTFTPDGKPFHAGNLSAQIALPSENGRRVTFWHAGDRNLHNLGGTLETLDGVRGPVAIGEGLLARDGWQVVDDSHGHLLVDGWVAARTWRGIARASLDWYLFAYGRDYRAALQALARVAGPVPTPRRAALGSWYSRYWPHTSVEFRGIVADYRRHGIPLDIMVLDMDWHSGSARDRWTGWSWNRELLPDAEELVEWLHGQSLRVALNLHPADGVSADEDRYDGFMRAQGANPAMRERLPFDAGNRPYMRALFEQVLAPLEAGRRRGAETKAAADGLGAAVGGRGGVDIWWLDWQQDRFVPSIPGLTNLAWLNSQFYQHSARNGKRGVNLSRWAGLPFGDHRHPVHFSGDAHTGWAMLAFEVPFTVAAGNAGCFYWSHDIGGHFGPRLEECTARWCWFGALSAAMRLHSARTAALDRRPWNAAEPFASAMRAAFALRAALMPQIDAAAHEGEDRMLPLLRPMYLDHAGFERAYRVHHEYMLGQDLLTAPITSPGIGRSHVAATHVWFPPGSAWFNWFTHERFAPGTEAGIAAEIGETPLFVPGGVPILTRAFSHRPATDPIEHLIVRLYPGAEDEVQTRELHEDDGETLGYRRSAFRRTPVTATWRAGGRLEVSIGPAQGGFDGAVSERTITLAIGGVDGVDGVRVDGCEQRAEEDRESGLFTVPIGPCGVDRGVRIEACCRLRSAEEYEQRDRLVRAARAAKMEGERESSGAQSVRLAAMWGIAAWAETDAAAGVCVDGRARPDAVRICDPFGSIDEGRVRAELIERVGPGAGQELASSVLDLRPAHAESLQLPLQALEEPPLGLRAMRLVRLSFTVHGASFVHEVCAETRVRALTAFAVRGPFPWDWRKPIGEQVFEPERAGRDAGRGEGWAPAHGGEKWPVDLRRAFPHAKGIGYAATVIGSEREQMAVLSIECGDKAEVWLNGERVFVLDGHDTVAALESNVRIRLPAGDSVLLIKTNDGGGGWGFAATLDGEQAVRERLPGS